VSESEAIVLEAFAADTGESGRQLGRGLGAVSTATGIHNAKDESADCRFER